jgi:hypothetical protein
MVPKRDGSEAPRSEGLGVRGMIRIFLVGAPVMILCLALQSTIVAVSLRHYAMFRVPPKYKASPVRNIGLLAVVMIILTIGSLLQVAIWGALFLFLGEFDRPETALYYSAVNFSTLGYGDIVMSERWRLLGPLEAMNGILMFGVSTALMTASVNYVVKQNRLKREFDDEPPSS